MLKRHIVRFILSSLPVLASAGYSQEEIEKDFKSSLLNMSEGKPIEAATKLNRLAQITDAPRIKLELGMAYLSSGDVSKGIDTLIEVSKNSQLPPTVEANVKQVVASAQEALLKPYYSINGGIDSNPKNLPAKQDVLLFGTLPMSYDPGEDSAQQSYVIYTIGVKGQVSRLINYSAYATQTDYEKADDLDGIDYGVSLSSLWGNDITHVKTALEIVRADRSSDGYKGIASLDITPDVFSDSPVTMNGSYTEYQADDSVRAGYSLTSLTVAQDHYLNSGRSLTPSLTLDFYEPNSGINAYKGAESSLSTNFRVFGYDLQASASLGLKEYRKKDIMFNQYRQDVSSGLSFIIPVKVPEALSNPLRVTVGYEHSMSSITFYDYAKVTLKFVVSD